MAQINVKLECLRVASSEENHLAALLSSYASEVRSINSNLRFEIAGRDQIASSLRKVAEQLEAESKALSNLASAARNLERQYRSTEDAIASLVGLPVRSG